MIKSQGLTGSALFVIPIKLKANLTFSVIYCIEYFILKNEFYTRIEYIIRSFKQLPIVSLQINGALMTSSNHYIN